jgi:hypothetical protein
MLAWLLVLSVAMCGTAGCGLNRAITPDPKLSQKLSQTLNPQISLPPLWKLTDWNGARETRAEAWERWAKRHLLTGDVLFVTGENRVFLGLVDFSELTRELTRSEFSHVAVVAQEADGLFVYDTISSGPRRTPFGDFMADPRVWTVAVKRLTEPHRDRAESAVQYCREVVRQKRPFDTEFADGEDRLYCSELVELAFRDSRLALSQLKRIDQLPGYSDVPESTRLLLQATAKIDEDRWVYVPGNDEFGIWACPYLQLVLPATSASDPPAFEEPVGLPEDVDGFLSAHLINSLEDPAWYRTPLGFSR